MKNSHYSWLNYYYLLFGILLLAFIGACGGYERQEGPTIASFSNPPPETISFSSYPYKLERPMAGIGAFVLENNLYVVTYTDAGSIYKVGINGLEKVIDGRDFGFVKRGAFNVEVVGDKAYIIGGAIDRTVSGCTAKVSTGAEYDCSTDEVWVFDENKLTKVSPMRHAREVFASGVVDSKIYVIGGWFPNEENINEKSIEVFDGSDWKEIPYSGTYYPVRSAAYATVGKKIYLFGGCLMTDEKNPTTFSCNTSLNQVFNTQTSTFSQQEPMLIQGRHFSGQHAVVRGKYIYVFGGATSLSDTIFDDVAVYDTEADAWQILSVKMVEKRKSTGAAILGDRLWVFGGITCDKTKGYPAEGGSKTATDTIEYGIFSNVSNIKY